MNCVKLCTFLRLIINPTYLMSDDLKQMLAALTTNSQNHTKLIEQQNAMLQQHKKTLDEHGNKIDKMEKRLKAVEGKTSKKGSAIP